VREMTLDSILQRSVCSTCAVNGRAYRLEEPANKTRQASPAWSPVSHVNHFLRSNVHFRGADVDLCCSLTSFCVPVAVRYTPDDCFCECAGFQAVGFESGSSTLAIGGEAFFL
jgi:hypothetical protein